MTPFSATISSPSSLRPPPSRSNPSPQLWPPRIRTFSYRSYQMKLKFAILLQTTFSWTVQCCNGALPLGRTSRHPIQMRFSLPVHDFLHGFLDHYKIELVHLNPNSILLIVVFNHLCEAFLQIAPNFPLFKNYFFLKYQPSAANQKVIGGICLQNRPRAGFLGLPLKSSLWGWHQTWFYCKNHEPSVPPFVGWLPEFQGTWSEEPTPLELPQVVALTNKINFLKEKAPTGICVAAHWLARRVQLPRKHIHMG
jgi:hypothetical protein